MGYKTNTKAYELFIQLEVGLRELLIQSIRSFGVFEWSNNFLGHVQKETIQDVVKRINLTYQEEKLPEVSDQYIYKLSRAKKELGFMTLNLYHPFYYLNWTDIESIMRLKKNTELLDNQIGKLNRETIIELLKPLNHLRNNIAHSRFITDNDFKFIKSTHESISSLIIDFDKLVNNQSTELTLENLFEELKSSISKIENTSMLSLQEIEEIDCVLFKCQDSFWLNSENLELIKLIKDFRLDLDKYRFFRVKPGGLLDIQNFRPKFNESLLKIKHLIYA